MRAHVTDMTLKPGRRASCHSSALMVQTGQAATSCFHGSLG